MSKISLIIELTGTEIPDYVELRARIAGNIITANIEEDDEYRLDFDPLVNLFLRRDILKLL